jgi:riboflavin kinase/FMN adenylyltransferase
VKLVSDIEKFKLPASVVTIGIFDGVHCAHQQLIHSLNEASKKLNLPSVLITMWPHPRKYFNPQGKMQLLTTLEEKTNILSSSSLDYLMVYPFTSEFANTSYETFVEEHLVTKLGVQYVIIGYNHHFGKNREGNFESLKGLAAKHQFKAERLEKIFINDYPVSSSETRNAILEGNIERANTLLGRFFVLTGNVVEGKKLGRTINYPTANIEIENTDKIIPKDGVYAVQIKIDNTQYYGMLNIGKRPTVSNENNKSIEVHIFDFNKNIYNKTISVEFIYRLRDEFKFGSINELKEQLRKDEIEARKKFRIENNS